MSARKVISEIDIASLPRGRHEFSLTMTESSLGGSHRIPVIIIKGGEGPTVGVTAAVHGNELNGVFVIHRLKASLDPEVLAGTVIMIPVVNVFGFVLNDRYFIDAEDLNRVMPGSENGTESEAYAATFVRKVLPHFNYLLDLHTASFGRINSFYVRANMKHAITAKLAHLIDPQIIVDRPPADGTLRGAAADMGIPAVTVEIGDPLKAQKKLIRFSRNGVESVLEHLGLLPPDDAHDEELDDDPPIVCPRSEWIRAKRAGLFTSKLDVAQKVPAGDSIGRIVDVFGNPLVEVFAPADVVIVGRAVNPVVEVGARLVHVAEYE